MAYKQHSSPFNNNLKGSFTNPNTRNNSSGNLKYPDPILNETADGTTVEEPTGEEDENTEKGMNDDMVYGCYYRQRKSCRRRLKKCY